MVMRNGRCGGANRCRARGEVKCRTVPEGSRAHPSSCDLPHPILSSSGSASTHAPASALMTNAWLELWAKHEIISSLLYIETPACVTSVTVIRGISSFLYKNILRLPYVHSILSSFKWILNIISSHVRKSRNCDAFPLQFLSFVSFLVLGRENSVIVQMTEITRTCFSPRPLTRVSFTFAVHLSVLP